MPHSLGDYPDDLLRRFLRRVQTPHLQALLRDVSESDRQRLEGLLSPASRRYLLDAEPSRRGRAEQAAKLLGALAAGGPPCIFCQILEGSAPASFVHRDEQVAAFMDLFPVTPGHLLIIPIAHHEFLPDVAPPTVARMMQLGRQLGEAAWRSELGCDGFNLFLADGGAAHQEVYHAHLHMLPRFHGDGFGLAFPSGYPKQAPREQLDEQAGLYRHTLREPAR